MTNVTVWEIILHDKDTIITEILHPMCSPIKFVAAVVVKKEQRLVKRRVDDYIQWAIGEPGEETTFAMFPIIEGIEPSLGYYPA